MSSDPAGQRDVVSFTWPVATEGYCWEEVRVEGKVRDRMVARLPPGHVGRLPSTYWVIRRNTNRSGIPGTRDTHPLDEYPALFRSFAGLNPTDRDALLAFANTHGLLGVIINVALRPGDKVPAAGEPCSDVLPFGHDRESAAEWTHAVTHMKRAVEWWDLIVRRDAEAMSRHLTRARPAQAVAPEYVEDFGTVRFTAPTHSDGWFYDSHPGLPDDDESAKQIRVREYCAPADADILAAGTALLWTWINRRLERKISVRVAPARTTGQPVMHMVPNTLLTALWLQFARAITGNKQYRSCRECGEWFELSGDDDGRTARREFCSDPCKSRDYRRRKNRTLALSAERLTPKQIASQLKAEGMETDAETIRKWAAKARG
jgi:hypothetical protein